MIKLKDILLGKYDKDKRVVIRGEPQTHKLQLPFDVPAKRWKELKLLLGNSEDKAKSKLKTLLLDVLKGLD